MKKYYLLTYLIFIFIQSQEGPTVGLVLSGGGAKGFAHIEVLKQLEESGVRIDYIGGTSMGAIIGSLYSAGYSADELDSLVHTINLNDLIFNFKDRKSVPLFDKTYSENYILDIPFDRFKPNLPNAISNTDAPYLFLSELLINHQENECFSNLDIPFYCVATNLETGKEKVFDCGVLPKAAMASASLPSILQPTKIGDSLYVDGGVVNNFPAKEMKNRGLDIIIGVELGQGLKDREELKNAADILVQVSNYAVKENVTEQLKYVDILIKPNLKEYSPTSFAQTDSIMARGKIVAEKYKPDFDSIANLQNHTATIYHDAPDVNEQYCILKIQINGNQNFNSDYVKGKLGFRENESLSPKQLTDGMINLLQTNNYKNADYQLIKTEGGYDININLVENKSKLLARLGVHYDKEYKTGILVNLTSRNFIFNNTSASFDMVLGDRLRYYLNIFGDNGIKPSIGFQSKYLNAPIKISNEDNNFNYINYDFNWFYNTFYIQSTLKDKYALGLGVDYDFAHIESDALSDMNPEQTLAKSYYFSPKAYLRVDTQDNPNFPKKGWKFFGMAKYAAISNQEEFIPNIQLSGKLDLAITLDNVVTFQQEIYMNIQGKNNSFIFENQLGGINQQKMLYFQPFYGYEYASLSGLNAIKLASTIQIQLFKNNYLSFVGNLANVENELVKLRFFDYAHTGVGFNYGYDSPLGPINLYYGYSTQVKKNLVYFSLGYWF